MGVAAGRRRSSTAIRRVIAGIGLLRYCGCGFAIVKIRYAVITVVMRTACAAVHCSRGGIEG